MWFAKAFGRFTRRSNKKMGAHPPAKKWLGRFLWACWEQGQRDAGEVWA